MATKQQTQEVVQEPTIVEDKAVVQWEGNAWVVARTTVTQQITNTTTRSQSKKFKTADEATKQATELGVPVYLRGDDRERALEETRAAADASS